MKNLKILWLKEKEYSNKETTYLNLILKAKRLIKSLLIKWKVKLKSSKQNLQVF